MGPAGTAWAQSGDPPAVPTVVVESASSADALSVTSAPWRMHFGTHAARVLRESNPRTREAALKDLIVLAGTDRGTVDLSATLMPLLEIVEEGTRTEHRLMALQALSVIGVEHSSERAYGRAMAQLYEIAKTEPKNRVRHSAAATLVEFFGSSEDK